MRKPYFQILYKSKDITKNFDPYLNSCTYVDKTTEEADSVEIVLNNGSQIFSRDWYPQRGAKISIKMGYDDDILDCGEFEIDEIGLEWTPIGDTITISGISAIISAPYRTRHSKAYEKINLENLAKTIAANGKLTVKGKIDNIFFDRITQNDETDLAFMYRIASLYGYTFVVKPGYMLFTKNSATQELSSKINFGETNIARLRVIDGSERTFIESDHRYYDRNKKKVIAAFAKKDGKDIGKVDRYIGINRAENEAQAQAMAKAALLKSENNTVKGSITTNGGNTSLRAGINITISDLGVASGTWQVESSTHMYVPSAGYNSEGQIFKIR